MTNKGLNIIKQSIYNVALKHFVKKTAELDRRHPQSLDELTALVEDYRKLTKEVNRLPKWLKNALENTSYNKAKEYYNF